MSDHKRLDFLIETGAWILRSSDGKWVFLVPGEEGQPGWIPLGVPESDTPRGAIDAAWRMVHRKPQPKARPKSHLSPYAAYRERLARWKKVLALKESGKTYGAIAVEIGVSRGRVQQLVSMAERVRRMQPDDWRAA